MAVLHGTCMKICLALLNIWHSQQPYENISLVDGGTTLSVIFELSCSFTARSSCEVELASQVSGLL